MKKYVFTILVAGVAALGVSGCASKAFVDGDQAPVTVRKKFVEAHSAGSCKNRHGVWQSESDATVFHDGGYCQYRAGDGGIACKSSADCEGYCELYYDEDRDQSRPKCSTFLPPRYDRCLPGYFEAGKVSGRGECFGNDSEVQ